MDDRELRRLAEIGVDVYLPRVVAHAPQATAASPPIAATAAVDAGGVLLLADASNARGAALLAGVVRALAFARIACAQAAVAEESALATARALVAFGDMQARAAGAALSAQRQREIGWVVTAEPATLAGDARAKRALWSELKRVVRPLRQAPR
jgi:hypothetical protein